MINRVFEKYPGKFSFSVSYTTRAPREGEVNGVHYHFVDREGFEKIVEEDGFIEFCDVHGKCYGTAVCELTRIKDEQKIPVLDIDVQGAQKVHGRKIDSVFVFVLPTQDDDMEKVKEVLEKRLRGRGTESEEQIQNRLTNAVTEIEAYKASNFINHTLVNDNLEVAR